ncbi:hypothetical protein RI138_19035 [Streptomyces sp. C11-1]|uniref:Lipoprotein n=1 Tax=Streptomyces durocortorensis TaxID=2811104 RepID=A0ABY9W602_9ACTN|nr:hypothetical protein [Streptomyces durocortorensis]WNF28756.1 hypothetical protein RI138_19035 [Streptomyces durocortorensis]
MKIRPPFVVLLAVSAAALTACSGSGQELGYGEEATGDGVDVTVVRVEAGSAGDLTSLKDAAKYDGRTPYYLHYRVTKTKDGDVKGPSFDVANDKNRLTRLSILPSFPTPTVGDDGELSYSPAPKFEKCTDDQSSSDFNKAPQGETYEACSIYLSAEGDTSAPSEVTWVEGAKNETVAVWK